jgi:hypothetical protein
MTKAGVEITLGGLYDDDVYLKNGVSLDFDPFSLSS